MTFNVAPSLGVASATDALGALEEHWRDVGRLLKVPNASLNFIEVDNSTSRECLKAVLQFFLYRCPSASWRHIIFVLKWVSESNPYYAEEVNKTLKKIEGYAEKLTGKIILMHVH